MVDQLETYKKLISCLDSNSAEYKLFEHRVALTYEDLAQVQKEAGFFGTEGKCMVLKADDAFVVYVTLQGKKVNMGTVKLTLNSKKVRLATSNELKEYFGAEAGCAYPFGFDSKYTIYVDPKIYAVDWFLFSPVFPNKTVQVKGENLQKVFTSLKNIVIEATNFNQ